MSLTILLGDYGSGKTTTAKMLAKQYGGIYLSSEMLTRGDVPLVDKLKSIMKPYNNYYLDGWNGNYHFENLPQLFGLEVRYIVCLAAPERIYEAQAKRGLKQTPGEVREVTQNAISIALTYDHAPLFADTNTYPVTFWGKGQWLSRWMEINLYSQLKGKNEYQDVDLNGYYIDGLSQSYKTWVRIASLIDFKGKTVCDYGCNLGYFSFKAEEYDASKVIAVDVSSSVIATARSIAMVRNSKVHFVMSDLKKYRPHKADIILALNTLHHLDYDSSVIDRIFSSANTIVLELPVKDLDKINSRGIKPVIAQSHREGRCIAVYSSQKIVVPDKFTYHLRREAIKWWLIHNGSKFMPFKGIRRLAKRLLK